MCLCKWKWTQLCNWVWLSCKGLTGCCFLMLCPTVCMWALAVSAPAWLYLLLGYLHCSSTTVCEVSQWARPQNASSWKAASFYFPMSYFRINLFKPHCHWVWNFFKCVFKTFCCVILCSLSLWGELISLCVFLLQLVRDSSGSLSLWPWNAWKTACDHWEPRWAFCCWL